MAHEIGHGVFVLFHPHQELPADDTEYQLGEDGNGQEVRFYKDYGPVDDISNIMYFDSSSPRDDLSIRSDAAKKALKMAHNE